MISLQCDCGAGWGVELGLVMRFADGEGVAFQLGEFRSEAEELLHADGKIGSVEQRSAALDCQRLHVRQVRVPAGSANDDGAAQGQDSAHVFKGCFRIGEVDDYVDAGQVGAVESGGCLIFMDVERAHAVAPFASHLRDQTAGFPFAEDENEHIAPVVRFRMSVVSQKLTLN
jgi:hypothetical protein